jgi:glutathione S-transferase
LAVLDKPQFPEFAEAQRARAIEAMRFLDSELADRAFVAGEAFTIADITAFVAMELTKLARIEAPAELAHLARWRAAMGARPSAVA